MAAGRLRQGIQRGDPVDDITSAILARVRDGGLFREPGRICGRLDWFAHAEALHRCFLRDARDGPRHRSRCNKATCDRLAGLVPHDYLDDPAGPFLRLLHESREGAEAGDTCAFLAASDMAFSLLEKAGWWRELRGFIEAGALAHDIVSICKDRRYTADEILAQLATTFEFLLFFPPEPERDSPAWRYERVS